MPFSYESVQQEKKNKKQKKINKKTEYDWKMAVKQQKSNKAKNRHNINTRLHSINRL